MRIRAFAVTAAILMIGGATLAAADSKKTPKVWKEQWSVTGRPSVRVRTGDARVVIHTRDGSGVAAEVRETGEQKGLFVGDRDPQVTFERDGTLIVINARMHGVTGGIVWSDYKLEVDVWVPKDTDLDVKTSDGDIEVLGLKGDLTLMSSDGDIDAGGLDGRLHLRTHDGDGEVAGRFDALTARSSDGHLELTVTQGSALAEPWTIESSDGRIGLRIPADLKAYLDAKSRDGSLDIDVPISVRGKFHRNELQGELNGGDQVLTLRSSDGGIHVSALQQQR